MVSAPSSTASMSGARMTTPSTGRLPRCCCPRQSGTDTGFHGTELSFDEGRLLFGLIRFWPGNAIAVRTRAPLPAREWVHITASYSGSGRAAGLRLYIQGQAVETVVVRDQLTK